MHIIIILTLKCFINSLLWWQQLVQQWHRANSINPFLWTLTRSIRWFKWDSKWISKLWTALSEEMIILSTSTKVTCLMPFSLISTISVTLRASTLTCFQDRHSSLMRWNLMASRNRPESSSTILKMDIGPLDAIGSSEPMVMKMPQYWTVDTENGLLKAAELNKHLDLRAILLQMILTISLSLNFIVLLSR